ncbi:hypothetical protein E4T47_03299 [Aureobasidium subglaciale]|nr:hypothetical protein E4T47_03299 [Aureobasidium subglaciale]
MAEENTDTDPTPTTRPAPDQATESPSIVPVRIIKIGDSSEYASDGIGNKPRKSIRATRMPDTNLLLLVSGAINANPNYIRELGNEHSGYRVQLDIDSGPPKGYALFKSSGTVPRVYGHPAHGFFESTMDLGEHFYRIIINDTDGCHCALCSFDVGLSKEFYMEKDSGPRDTHPPPSPGPDNDIDYSQLPESLGGGRVLWRY